MTQGIPDPRGMVAEFIASAEKAGRRTAVAIMAVLDGIAAKRYATFPNGEVVSMSIDGWTLAVNIGPFVDAVIRLGLARVAWNHGIPVPAEYRGRFGTQAYRLRLTNAGALVRADFPAPR